MLQKSDEGELKAIVEEIVNEHPEVVSEYKGGKESALQFLVGQGMKATKGSANPQVLIKLLKELM
jgi:aspartyl-tRNA(Asn)/glutamyl-tRNA(Gln) amidotransferase subunit B